MIWLLAMTTHPSALRRRSYHIHSPRLPEQDYDGVRDPAIEAFVIAADGKSVVPEELRRFLQEQLPEQMQPSSINAVQVIPRAVTGSPDARALAQMLVEKKHVGARNPIEE